MGHATRTNQRRSPHLSMAAVEWISSQYVLVVITVLGCAILQVNCQNSALKCPKFKSGEVGTLNLTVDNTTFSNCARAPETITCNFKPPASAEVLVCPVDVTKCDTSKASQGCTCVKELSTGYIYTLNFTLVTEIHQGGNYSCNMDCLAAANLAPVVDIDASCMNVNVAAGGGGVGLKVVGGVVAVAVLVATAVIGMDGPGLLVL